VKAGAPVKGALFFDNEKKTISLLQESGSSILDIKYDSIKDITYEKASKPRYAEAVLISPFFLLSNSKKHDLTFQYDDPSGQGKYAIIYLDKKNAREQSRALKPHWKEGRTDRREVTVFVDLQDSMSAPSRLGALGCY
jgi:hypothetical protein